MSGGHFNGTSRNLFLKILHAKSPRVRASKHVVKNKTHNAMPVPRARDKFSPPLTRPSHVTRPPAFTMRSCSDGSSGLWSSDMLNALPSRQRTQRESPALATYSWSSLSNAITAVQPLSAPGYNTFTNTLTWLSSSEYSFFLHIFTSTQEVV